MENMCFNQAFYTLITAFVAITIKTDITGSDYFQRRVWHDCEMWNIVEGEICCDKLRACYSEDISGAAWIAQYFESIPESQIVFAYKNNP